MQVSAYPHDQATEVFKALSDPMRLRILGLLLTAGELCGCEVEGTLQITQTRASRALTTLRRAGLIVDRREGAWVHYSVAAKPGKFLKSILNGLRAELAEDPAIQRDLQNLQRKCC